ncbi:MAG: hypothetical protein HC846_10500 [Blastocatellia bacterium]|nr:hypothetical protein [Blastocatellia bacterium]
MLFRAIALSLALLVGIGTVIPFMTDSTEAGPKYKKKKKKKLKKYSKAWWKWYKKQQRKKRAMLARKRALRAKQILLARQRANRAKNTNQVAKAQSVDKKGTAREKVVVKDNSAPATLPSGKKAPKSFKQNQASDSELQFRVSDDSGNNLGSASLSVVGPAMGEDSDSGRNKMVGGVSTSSLRRNVIDKMIKEEGWVVNDYHKNVNGKKVYVVVAQSSVRGVVQSRLFYFTEVDGKIYTLATTSPNEAQERIAQESEKVIQSLQRGNRPTQALNK